MKNEKKVCIGIFVAFILLLSSCQSGNTQVDGVWVADVREAIQTKTPISMKEDVESIEYIPLETLDSCLVSNITDLLMDDEFIFIQNGRSQQILQFTRQGKFVREIGKVGEGPGEYAPYSITELSLNGKKREIYAHREHLPSMVFSYEGEFLHTDTITAYEVGNCYVLENGFRALAGAPITPIQHSPWLVALQDANNQLIDTKAPFPATLPAESCYMKEIQFVPFQNSAVAYTPCSDTLFRVSLDGITPACILDRKNGAEYYMKVADINEFAKDDTSTSSIIELFSFFETPRYFYFRTYLSGNDVNQFFVQRLDKKNGELLSQPVAQDFVSMSVGFSDGNVIGLENDLDGGVPFCPQYIYKDEVCVQVVNAETIAKLEEKGLLKNKPEALQLGDDENPIVLIYTLKK